MFCTKRLGIATAAAVCTTLVGAASASAGRIDYAVPPSPTGAYTVDAKGNGNGIVKVQFNSCATAGQALVLPLDVTPRGPIKGQPTADWKVIKDGAADLSFDPSQVRFDGGTEKTRITITPTAASESGARLRIKLDGENGSGLGEGPGIKVDFACVLAPGPVGGAGNNPPPPAGCPTPATTRAAPADTGRKDKSDPGKVKDDDPLDGDNGGGNSPSTPPPSGNTSPPGPAECNPPGQGTGAPTAAGTSDARAAAATPTVGSFPVVGSSLASRAAKCVAVPKRLKAVAGEQTTLRVQVRVGDTKIRNSTVRVTTPDGTVTKRTDANGVVIFRVRPSRSGRLTVQADSCFGSRTIRVRGARVTGRQGVSPQFAG